LVGNGSHVGRSDAGIVVAHVRETVTADGGAGAVAAAKVLNLVKSLVGLSLLDSNVGGRRRASNGKGKSEKADGELHLECRYLGVDSGDENCCEIGVVESSSEERNVPLYM
jgi:hypothetical protein